MLGGTCNKHCWPNSAWVYTVNGWTWQEPNVAGRHVFYKRNICVYEQCAAWMTPEMKTRPDYSLRACDPTESFNFVFAQLDWIVASYHWCSEFILFHMARCVNPLKCSHIWMYTVLQDAPARYASPSCCTPCAQLLMGDASRQQQQPTSKDFH